MVAPYFIRKNLKQTLVYWGNPKDDGEGGYTFDEPVEIRGRCEYRTEIIRAGMNEELVSRARVYLALWMIPTLGTLCVRTAPMRLCGYSLKIKFPGYHPRDSYIKHL